MSEQEMSMQQVHLYAVDDMFLFGLHDPFALHFVGGVAQSKLFRGEPRYVIVCWFLVLLGCMQDLPKRAVNGDSFTIS